MRRYFGFFLLSGFAGLVYETVWLRLAMADYGVTAVSLSIVLSVFMGGLALGAWLVARLRGRLEQLDARGAALLYAACEVAIAVFGWFVPGAFRGLASATARALRGAGPWAWYAAETVEVALAMLPACTAMGATLPLGVFALARGGGPVRRFSYLYLANVLGAVLGTLLSAFVFIELVGFRGTLQIAALANAVVAALCLALARHRFAPGPVVSQRPEPDAEPVTDRRILVALFFSGLCSMGLEVVWTRLYTPFVGTVVYSFASILALYLASTFAGSMAYRVLRPSGSPLRGLVWAAVAVMAAAPLLATDWAHFADLRHFNQWQVQGFGWRGVARVACGVAPASFALGFLTPHLVDRWSGGSSSRTGVAYAVNTIGCILGPLVAGFVLLPLVSERAALILLCVPWLALALGRRDEKPLWRWSPAAVAAALLVGVANFTSGLEHALHARNVQRDHTATTLAYGEGMNKRLLVNGVGMTSLTPITKAMAHLPFAALGRTPRNALIICFGMGTTFRSARSWDVPTTAVELVPGVPRLFSYFHGDAERILSRPGARIVVDDGRRFVDATDETFDIVILDPPPPVQAASSSLLYSREFYEHVRARLAPDGILQQWIPGGDTTTLHAMGLSIAGAFPHVRAFRGFGFGFHILASERPILLPDPGALAARLPPAAAADFVEWGPMRTPQAQFQLLLRRELPLREFLASFAGVPELSDDRPVNEYDFLRSRYGIGPIASPLAAPRTASREGP